MIIADSKICFKLKIFSHQLSFLRKSKPKYAKGLLEQFIHDFLVI